MCTGDRWPVISSPAQPVPPWPRRPKIEVSPPSGPWEFRYPGAAVSATEAALRWIAGWDASCAARTLMPCFYVPAFGSSKQVNPGRLDRPFSHSPPGRAPTGCGDSEIQRHLGSAANQVDVVSRAKPTTKGTGWRRPSRLPLQPGLSDPSREVAPRQSDRRRRDMRHCGFLRRPPMVNVPGSNTLPHDG